MNSKWNEKLNQVTENTLIVGMDIAKSTHYACFVDERGRVLEKAFAVHQSREGFEALYQNVLRAMKAHGKTDVIVGIEPTGHYWMNLAYFLDSYGISLVMVNPLHVKRSKELDDNLQTKNDKKDAVVIARLMKDGRFSYPRILKDIEAELRIGSTLRSKLTEDLSSIKNRIIRWLDRYFPEFTQVYPTFGKMAFATLEKTPLPQDIVGKTAERPRHCPPTPTALSTADEYQLPERELTPGPLLLRAERAAGPSTLPFTSNRRERPTMAADGERSAGARLSDRVACVSISRGLRDVDVSLPLNPAVVTSQRREWPHR